MQSRFSLTTGRIRPSAVTPKLGESLVVLIGWRLVAHTTDAGMAWFLDYRKFRV
jgi:hypothetical protein